MKIGDRVQLKKSYAKWHLDHPDIYFFKNVASACFDNDTVIHLACCLGEPVHGEILEVDRYVGSMLVQFKIGTLSMRYWVEEKHVKAIR